MRRIKGAKPSPALIVAIVALVAALAGTAIGGVAVTSLSKKDKKQVTKIAKKQGKKQANKQIVNKAPGLSVASAKTADSANGVKPVKVLFTAGTNSAEKVFLNEGGIRIEGECNALGQAEVHYVSTANNGDFIVSFTGAGGGSYAPFPDFDQGQSADVPTTGTDIARQSVVSYRGADGTVVTGELLQVELDNRTPRCRIAGTLFVS